MDWITDAASGARCAQAMVPMRDGISLNTFVFLPPEGARFPVILHRTPYGIAAADARDKFDVLHAWLPNPAEPMRGSILRGWRAIVAHGYAAVYQDCRGRHGSEGEDRVYADDAADGYDTLDWIAAQNWTNGRVGMSGSSAGATTTFAAAATRHPSLRAFFAQAGGSSIYDDVVYEGQSIEMERLWLWVSRNIPGLSAGASRRREKAVRHRRRRTRCRRRARGRALQPARRGAQCLAALYQLARLDAAAARRHPRFRDLAAVSRRDHQPPRARRFPRRHDFRRTIDIPGFHVTSWFDIFQTSVIAAFQDIQARTGTQKLWIGPNEHYFVYAEQFLAARPVFRLVRLLAEGREDRADRRACRCSIRRAHGSRTAPPTGPTTGSRPSAGRRPA